MGILDRIFQKKDQKPEHKPDFGNVTGGGSSAATSTRPAPGSPSAATTGRTYTVVAGDSLSKIAQREYGDAAKWRVIFEANRDSIQNPDLIHPGQKLKLPSA